jgi:SAM-dependent methyltransferase
MSAAAGGTRRSQFVLDDSNWSHKAWMSQVDANLFERVLVRKAEAAQDSFQVLEWGAGRSTLFFSDLLNRLGVHYHWLSLEYDPNYIEHDITPKLAARGNARVLPASADTVADAGRPGVSALDVVVFDHGPLQPFLDGHEPDRLADLDSYVDYPARLGRQYDFIFVDGRKRRRCLLEAARLLKPGGVVMLHDAYRPHYQCAFPAFASQRMLGEILWIGAQEKTDFLNWIT